MTTKRKRRWVLRLGLVSVCTLAVAVVWQSWGKKTHDHGLEQPAYGLYLTILDVAGVQAPGRTAVPPSVDAAEFGIVAGEGRAIAGGGGGSACRPPRRKCCAGREYMRAKK